MTVPHKSADIDKELFHNERLWRPQDVLSRKHAASQRAQANSVLFLKIPSLVLIFLSAGITLAAFIDVTTSLCYRREEVDAKKLLEAEKQGERERNLLPPETRLTKFKEMLLERQVQLKLSIENSHS